MLTVSATPRQPVALLVKRVTDLAGSAAALVVLSPVFAIAALLVKATSRGPVFFTQTRTGLNGRTFTLYKFRSMYRDAEARRFSIDELPQFWSVLAGDMSLVGPQRDRLRRLDAPRRADLVAHRARGADGAGRALENRWLVKDSCARWRRSITPAPRA